MNCVSIEQMFALTQNALPADEAEHIYNHLDGRCSDCKSQWDNLHELLADLAGHNLTEAPDWLIRQAEKRLAESATTSCKSDLKPVPAILLADSFDGGLLCEIRGAGPVSRQILYRAGNYDIDLSIDYIEQPPTIELLGQIMPIGADIDAATKPQVQLLSGPTIVSSTQMNEFGEFMFLGITEGCYDLRIALGDEELGIIGIDAVSQPH